MKNNVCVSIKMHYDKCILHKTAQIKYSLHKINKISRQVSQYMKVTVVFTRKRKKSYIVITVLQLQAKTTSF